MTMSSSLADAGARVMQAQAQQSAFIAMRAKPAPATFSTKALNFYNSEYNQSDVQILPDAAERQNYQTHD